MRDYSMDVLAKLVEGASLGDGFVCRIYREAAEEIIRLRAERDTLRAANAKMLAMLTGSGIVQDSQDDERV